MEVGEKSRWVTNLFFGLRSFFFCEVLLWHDVSSCYREEESHIYPVNCAWKWNLHRKHGDSNREDKHLSYKLGHQLTNFQWVHAITNIHVQRLLIGRIGNPWSMDYPKDQPRIVWSTGLTLDLAPTQDAIVANKGVYVRIPEPFKNGSCHPCDVENWLEDEISFWDGPISSNFRCYVSLP